MSSYVVETTLNPMQEVAAAYPGEIQKRLTEDKVLKEVRGSPEDKSDEDEEEVAVSETEDATGVNASVTEESSEELSGDEEISGGDEEEVSAGEGEEEDSVTNDEDGPTADEETEVSEFSDDEQQHPTSTESGDDAHEEVEGEGETKTKDGVTVDAESGAYKQKQQESPEAAKTELEKDEEGHMKEEKPLKASPMTATYHATPSSSPLTISSITGGPTPTFMTGVSGSLKGTAPIGSLAAIAATMSKDDTLARTSFVKVTTTQPQQTSTVSYSGSALKGLPYKVLSSTEIVSSYKPKITTTYTQNSLDQASTITQVHTDVSALDISKHTTLDESQAEFFPERQIDSADPTMSGLVLPAMSGVIPDPVVVSPAPVGVDFSEQSRRQKGGKAKRWGCGC